MKIDFKSEWDKNKIYWLLGGLCLVNLIAHLCCYPALPDVITTHWGIDGTPNGEGPKYMALILAVLPGVLLVLFRFLPKIDPKAANYDKFKPIWNTFVIAVIIFFVALTWVTELSAFHLLPDSGNLVSILVGGGCGLFFIVLGNYMPRIKQNYTFGCKTPWALADEHNWNRTQRMGGITFVVIGAVMLLCAVFGRVFPPLLTFLMPAAIIGGIIWIYLYSFLLFKNIMK